MPAGVIDTVSGPPSPAVKCVGPVTVVSSEPLALNGVPRFDDRRLPWNDALAAAMREVLDEPCAAVVSADLPLVTPADVVALVAATPQRGIAIARAKDGGTNAVSMRPPGALPTRFGEPGSAALHEQAAREAGLDAVVLDRPGLAFDVDTPEDLAAWHAPRPARHPEPPIEPSASRG